MNPSRKRAIIIGILFIAASAFSVLGLVSYGPILNNPEYIAKGPTSRNQIVLGALFELIAAAAATGTAIAFFPVLKKYNESLALGYFGFRLLEAVLIVVGLVSILTLLKLRQEFAGGALDIPSFLTADKLLRSIHSWAFILGPNFMFGINTMIYGSLLYQTRLVPRTIAAIGLIGAVLVFTAALLEMFGIILQVSVWGAVLAIPVALYEITLAIWLIVRGFNPSAIESPAG